MSFSDSSQRIRIKEVVVEVVEAISFSIGYRSPPRPESRHIDPIPAGARAYVDVQPMSGLSQRVWASN